jgi:hypothetical protein
MKASCWDSTRRRRSEQKKLLIKIDSHVVAGQVEKEYTAREQELVKYLAIVRQLE